MCDMHVRPNQGEHNTMASIVTIKAFLLGNLKCLLNKLVIVLHPSSISLRSLVGDKLNEDIDNLVVDASTSLASTLSIITS